MISRPSPHFDKRPPATPIDMLVLHYTGMESAEAALERMCDPAAPGTNKVSAHYMIDEDGTVVSMVAEDKRAWHAGDSCFRGRTQCNDYSLGIELEGEDETAYDDRQYEVLAAVIRATCQAYPDISARELAGHCDVAPGRKSDPGPAFDWLRLYDAHGNANEN